jgi:predicted ATP-dependent serine protease
MADLVDFRTGQIAVLAGAAGSGKSTFAANWVSRSKDTILYLAQEDPFSTYQVMTAVTTHSKRTDIYRKDVNYWSEKVSEHGRDNLIIVEGGQTVESIEAMLIALAEWDQETPPLTVVDSVFDLRSDAGGYMESAFYADVLPGLKALSLKYDTSFLLQHHVKRDGKQALGTEPLTMTSLMFGGEKEAAHVWGVYHRQDKREMYIQMLKQRGGRADATGGLSVVLDWDAQSGWLTSR